MANAARVKYPASSLIPRQLAAGYLISDLHIGHNREFLYLPRGFENIEEHDKAIFENWNRSVSEEDVIEEVRAKRNE